MSFGQSQYIRDIGRLVSVSVRCSLIIFETNAHFGPYSLIIFETRHAALLIPGVQRGRDDAHSQAHSRTPPERGSSPSGRGPQSPFHTFCLPCPAARCRAGQGRQTAPERISQQTQEVCCGSFGNRRRNSLDRRISLDRSRAVVCPFGRVRD